MLQNKAVLWAITIPFVVLTVYAVADAGYVGLIAQQMESPAGWQVLIDLCIAVLVLSWMIADARRTGRVVWPYVLLTFTLGSIGLLAYLLLAQSDSVSEADPYLIKH